jgi:selenocysteine lyase/cysteine desulfurase
MPRPVLTAVTEQLQQEALRGPMEVLEGCRERLERLYKDAATLLGCNPGEVAVLGSGSRGWQVAFASIPFKQGERILIGRAEWAGNHANLMQAASRFGVSVEVIPCDEKGRVSVEALERMMDERVRLISLTYLPANGGLINPAAEVGRIARAAGAIYMLDANQAVGQMPVDVEALGCDILNAAGRKYLRGPRGTGLLYVRRSLLERTQPPWVDAFSAPWSPDGPYRPRSDARRYETAEGSPALKLGLGAAIRYALDLGIENVWSRIQELSGYLRGRLSEIEGVTVRDLGEQMSGLVSLTVEGVEPKEVRQALFSRGINVTVNGLNYTPLDMAARGLSEIVRISIHCFNTTEELDRVCEVLRLLRSR